ncbi:hypothetical protein [Granulicella tundricola]|uniref:UbiA prenyltransferase n=1 Tax=Granulicella tundricola (strain ATCC BAA-1859 / DSM 23138 / MP5ACTX9) TaxID=1198114 RepID=E8X2A7_GRATM|nr:hypothetical protein [Granulicella tundricola]ADW68039.1 hypothetical protein AciX9_0972 [Granulicella tundricola MP5ACTX9]
MTTIVDAPSRTIARTAFEAPLIYWHLLSLDAPTVAALWTWFVARSAHISLPLSSVAAMFLAVWILYAADRLLDAQQLESAVPSDLEARHLFHHKHRKLFRIVILVCSLALAPLLLTIPAEAIRLYLIAGSLLFAWFVLIHAAPVLHGGKPGRLPKEIAVGVFFAAATFIPTVSRAPALRLSLLLPAILFAALCSLNCLFIYAWEHPTPSVTATAHPTTRVALHSLTLLAPILTFVAFLLAVLQHNEFSPLLMAIALSASLLRLLHQTRPASRIALRAAADFVLLTPLLFIPFQHWKV